MPMTPVDPSSEEFLIAQKTGAPLNSPVPLDVDPPASLWNSTENPHLPMDSDSLAARLCDTYMDEECSECRDGRQVFLMASANDFCLKQFTPDTYERDVYHLDQDIHYAPVDANNFPNVREGVWTQDGYPTLVQQAEHRPGGSLKKMVNRIGIEFDAIEQEPPGKLLVQLGTANTAAGFRWDQTPGKDMDVNPDTPESNVNDIGLRPARPVTYAFFRDGIWLAQRIYVTDSTGDTSPTDCAASFNRAEVSAKVRNTDWQNQ